ncbi:MAG: hypothetical protein K2X66_10640, partial [Cyanobacteria bacterium]|nr:hypothetical protein [Cyanobacteriota bacterium]
RDVSVLAKQLKYLDPGIHVEPLASNNSVVLSGEANTRESAQMALEIAKSFFGSGGGASGSPAPSAAPSPSAPSSSGGSAAPSAPPSAGSGSTISSIAPGSSLPNSSPRILNMIKVKGNPSTKLELAQQKLKEIDPNILIDIVPGNGGVEKVILTGRVATAGAISKAINTAGIFFGQPGLKVITGPGGKMIRPNGTGEFQSPNAFNDNLDINVLQGSIVTDATGNVISMMEVAQKPQIRCSVRFLNVQTTALRQLGTSFQISGRDLNLASFSGSQIPLTGKTITLPSGGANVSTLTTRTFDPRNNGNPVYAASSVMTSTYNVAQTLGGGITQAFSVNKLFLGALSALEEKRKLKSLAEPTLTLLSGEKASFLAGGEVPIPVLGTNGQITITYHEFGIRLNIIATVTDDGKIHMQVAPEVSTVDPTNSITTNLVTVPGFATRRMQTTLEMADGETFILAGLFSQEEADALSRFPGLGNLPVIGAALTGRNSDRRKNEMIVLIKPEIITTQGGDGLGFSGAAANITKELSKGTGLKEADPKEVKK